MHQFCFNDCIPKDGTDNMLVSCLDKTLRAYSKLATDFPNDVEGIITPAHPNNIVLNQNNFTLSDCMSNLDHAMKRVAYRVFTKYPIDANFAFLDTDAIIIGEYYIRINNISHKAENAKIVADNDGVLFSLAIHDDIKQNKLKIVDGEGKVTGVNNVFGENSNTDFLSSLIRQSIIAKLGNFDRLLSIIGNCSYNDKFKNSFEQLSLKAQLFVLEEFQFSIDRKGVSAFCPDDKLIKDVTPESENEIKVYELRIHSPVSIRIYFYESPFKVFLGGIDSKAKKKEQSHQIKNAASVINGLILLEK